MIRNAVVAALLVATGVLATGGAASAACEPLLAPVCPGAIRDPRDIECWHEPSTGRIWCEW